MAKKIVVAQVKMSIVRQVEVVIDTEHEKEALIYLLTAYSEDQYGVHDEVEILEMREESKDG